MDWEIPLLNIGYIVSVVGILCLIFSRLVLSMFFLLILVLAVVTWNSSVDFSFFGFFYTSFFIQPQILHDGRCLRTLLIHIFDAPM